MTPDEEQKLLIRIETMIKRMDRSEELLKQALPYIISHYERSGVGFGKSARILMNNIKTFLGIQ